MANHKSAMKRIRQTARRTARIRAHRSRLRTQVKTFRAAANSGSEEEVERLLGPTVSMVDKAVQKGVFHRNKGNRLKASLTLSANKVAAS